MLNGAIVSIVCMASTVLAAPAQTASVLVENQRFDKRDVSPLHTASAQRSTGTSDSL